MSRSPTRKMLTPVAATRMQAALQAQPHSLDDLSSVSDLAKPLVTRYIKALQAERMVHVGGWARDARGYPTIRQFAWGDKPDAVCPVSTRTSTERMRIRRAEQKGISK